MTLKTLEQRFAESSRQIYSQFSNGQALDPIIPDTAASRSRIKDDSRLLPVVSTLRDVRFISKFFTTNDGVLSIAKQLLLQTGNTFAETRLHNSASPLLNLFPSLHLTRHVGNPIRNLKTPTRDTRGALQKETVAALEIGAKKEGFAASLRNAVMSPFKALSVTSERTDYFSDKKQEFYIRPEDKAFWNETLGSFQPRLALRDSLGDRGKKKLIQFNGLRELTSIDAGDYENFIVNSKLVLNTSTGPRPPLFGSKVRSNPTIEYSPVPPADSIQFPNTRRGLSYVSSVFNVGTFNNKTVVLNANLFSNSINFKDISAYPLTTQIYNYSNSTGSGLVVNEKSVPFKTLEAAANGNGYFLGQDGYSQGIQPDGTTKETTYLLTGPGRKSATSGIKDPFNSGSGTGTAFYSSIAQDIPSLKIPDIGTKSDIIKFIFSHPSNGSKVQFRAFINSFKETVKPEFAEQRYIGRTERYVTYSGAKRTASISFSIAAFSQGEIDGVWKRVNYLTGLAYPRGVSASGFMIPPLFRLTIGGIYNDQPVYIDSLEHEFIDEAGSIVFDIDDEVSKVINVSMTVSLLEKESKFYDTPFYAITE